MVGRHVQSQKTNPFQHVGWCVYVINPKHFWCRHLRQNWVDRGVLFFITFKRPRNVLRNNIQKFLRCFFNDVLILFCFSYFFFSYCFVFLIVLFLLFFLLFCFCYCFYCFVCEFSKKLFGFLLELFNLIIFCVYTACLLHIE